MRVSELQNAPEWLKKACVANEDVEIRHNIVVWKSGDWKYGVWEHGVWESGTFHQGTWKDGVWKGGIFKAGNWINGVWQKGSFTGYWDDGIWLDGTFNGGTWERGSWNKGTQNSGKHSIRSKHTMLIRGTDICAGCKTKSYKEWREWLNGTEEFETCRDTEEFKLIRAHILALCTYIEETL